MCKCVAFFFFKEHRHSKYSVMTLPVCFALFCLQMLHSLRSLRNSAAKKRAKVRINSSDPESPDSALRLELGSDSPIHTSPVLASSANESGLSSLSSVANSSFNGVKTRCGTFCLSRKQLLKELDSLVTTLRSALCVHKRGPRAASSL